MSKFSKTRKSKAIKLAFVGSLIATACTTPHTEHRLYVRGYADEYAAVPVVGYVYPFYPCYVGVGFGYSSYVHHVGYYPGYVGSYSYHSTTVIHSNNGYRSAASAYPSSTRSSSSYGYRSSGSSSRSSSSSTSRGGFGSSSRSSSSWGGFSSGS